MMLDRAYLVDMKSMSFPGDRPYEPRSRWRRSVLDPLLGTMEQHVSNVLGVTNTLEKECLQNAYIESVLGHADAAASPVRRAVAVPYCDCPSDLKSLLLSQEMITSCGTYRKCSLPVFIVGCTTLASADEIMLAIDQRPDATSCSVDVSPESCIDLLYCSLPLLMLFLSPIVWIPEVLPLPGSPVSHVQLKEELSRGIEQLENGHATFVKNILSRFRRFFS